MKNEFIGLATECVRREVVRKLVFSRPSVGEIAKVSGRLCAHRGQRLLALEYSLPGNTVSHKNVKESELEATLTELMSVYRQANLLTTLGDVEWKLSGSGKEVLLGADKLKNKLSGEPSGFERAIESLDKKKNYLLRGDEDFLIKLGVSDKQGRVHDKKQGKFRQINRFLEHIEDIYPNLEGEKDLVIYDLCCGKSYLSFAVYYYLTKVKGRRVRMLGIDLKRDVIDWCSALASSLGYGGMTFVTDDIKNTPENVSPDMVISLHACDVATDVVINRAIELRAKVVLSTPCCHRYLNDRLRTPELGFVSKYPQLRNKLCEAITDAIRLARLSSAGYEVSALELTDPDDTPKNTLLRAILKNKYDEAELEAKKREYADILAYVLKDGAKDYLKGF